MRKPWSDEEVKRLKEWMKKTGVKPGLKTARQAREELNLDRSYAGIESQMRRILHGTDESRPPSYEKILFDHISINLPLDDAKKKHDQLRQIPRNCSMLVISDLHIPGVAWDSLSRALEEKTDICVINGDLIEFEHLGRWRSIPPLLTERGPSLQDELNLTTEVLQEINNRFKTVYYIAGNHDTRFLKKLADLPRDLLQEMVQRLDLWDFLMGKVQSSKIIPTPFYFQAFHNVVVAHPEQSSSVALRSPEWALKYIRNRGVSGVNVCVLGHTHGLGITKQNEDILIEGGSMCQSLFWQFSGRLHITQRLRAWNKGYVVIEFCDGCATWNSIRLVDLGIERWI